MSETIKTYTVAELEKKLTDREKKYCYHKIIEGNGAKAARLAGYKESNARGSSAENLAKPHIQQYIAHLKEDMEDVLGITKFKVAERVMKMAFSDIGNLHDTWIDRKEFDKIDVDARITIQEIDTRITKKFVKDQDGNGETVEVEQIKIKLADTKGYMDMLNKMMGYYEADKVDMTTKGESITSLRALTTEELTARAVATKTVERNEEQVITPKEDSDEETD